MEIASPKTVEATVPEGLALRGLVRSDVPALTELQNAAFEGSWGYQPNVPEEIAYRIYEQPLDQPDDVIVLANRDGTLAAYCWCEHGAPGEPGAVGMVGVSPSRQGQGLGRSVTAAGVDLLVAAGARPVEITVDEANEPGVRLYRRLGFEVVSRSVWYERALNE
jgi:mycothiol synthase